MTKKDYETKPVPSYCPVCGLGILCVRIMLLPMKDLETMRCRWRFCNCNSFFTWEAHDEIVSNIETYYSHGLMGNIDVEKINKNIKPNQINPKIPDKFDPPHYNHSRNFEECL